ncbi:methyltransferase domain-containing protein [Parvibaculaceae bacterium PLY_AMNH_Bact1]|nr:methyltransferase domain-containing protein [Parvibaculaceae bacterium PLY_AMNH_Bact1]
MTSAVAPFDRQLVARHRARAAKNFSAADFLVRRAGEEIGGRLETTNRTFQTALDLGCHNGLLARDILKAAGVETIISADLSPSMAVQAPAPSIAADEEFLPVRLGSLDLVTSALSLHWVNDLPGTLLQVRQALKPDGLFLTALFGGETLHELRDVLMQAEAECEGGVSPRVSPFADVRDLGGLLQRSGFALPVVDADQIIVRYDTIFNLMDDLRAMGETNAIAARRKTPLKRATLMRAAQLYQEKHADPDGRIRATFEILYATGWAPHESQQKPMRPGTAAMRLADALKTDELSTGEKAPRSDSKNS